MQCANGIAPAVSWRESQQGLRLLGGTGNGGCPWLCPLTFLGGAFYSISMLPPAWQKIALFNPLVYLISGFRWSFYGLADVDVVVSAMARLGFMAACLVAVWWIFRTGWKLKV
jgi:ABC-type multidrug transport system permease subunit